MLFQSKIDRAMKWLKEKNASESNSEKEYLDPRAEWMAEQNNKIELEKNDVLALFISAILVFGPVLLVFILILIWAYPG